MAALPGDSHLEPPLGHEGRVNSGTPVGPSPIQAILGVRIIQDQPPQPRGKEFLATSLPGHLLHYVLSGKVRQSCNGRIYNLVPGTVLWYHEDEEVRGRLLEGPWDFVSVHFTAPGLVPPPFENRIWQDEGALPHFLHLLNCFQDAAPSSHRVLRVHGALQNIILRFLPEGMDGAGEAAAAQLWWQVETELRRDLSRTVDMPALEQLAHASAATLTRACHAAVGQPPMRRLKQIRMSMARGLVRHSDLSMTQISVRLGYLRLHEFSRDYKRHFGTAPSLESRLRDRPKT